MSNRLANAFQRTTNLTRTENNAITHKSTLNPVLDFFFHAPARQGQDNVPLFVDAYRSDKNMALKALFYIGDVRQGKGQRNTFKTCLYWLAKNDPKVFDNLAIYVPEYGRWDELTDFPAFRVIQDIVKDTFFADLNNAMSGQGVTLLGKWMPSENASSKETKEAGLQWAKILGVSPREYRKALTYLRSKIGVVEQKMSAHAWDEIDYERVPSRASKIYREAFRKHDEARYDRYVEAAMKGEKKIHSAAVYPHELSATVRQNRYDKTIEAMWKALPNYFGDQERQVIVVVDTSSSMVQESARISGDIFAMDVSVGLGLYCAQRNQGAFHNYVLTFNTDSHIVKLDGKNLQDDITKTYKLPWGGSTSLRSAFQSILRMAIDNDVPAEEMPTDILIISDMEFNSADQDRTNLEVAKRQYRDYGYELPRITFWNVCSRHNQVPATQSEKGVVLVSGFSAETIGKVLQSKSTTPEDLMLETLNSERYAFINEIAR